MTDAVQAAGELAAQLGIESGDIVLEAGWDSDVDRLLSSNIAELSGRPTVDEDHDGVAEVVVLWFREGDDLLEVALAVLAPVFDHAFWLFTPRVGREGWVDPADIFDAAAVAELTVELHTLTLPEWSGTRLYRRDQAPD